MKRDTKRRIRHFLLWPFEWTGILLALAVFSLMPRFMLLSACDALSAVYYLFDRRGKRRALQNLHIIRGTASDGETSHRFDPDSAPYAATRAERLMIRRSYRNMTRTVGHIFWTLVFAKRRAAIAGELSIAAKAFLEAHRPVITVSAHLGCWEVLSQLAFLAGHSMISVAKDIGTRGMTGLLMRSRRSIGQEIVSSEGAFKALYKGIKGGKSLGLLVDQKVDPGNGGVWIRFLGLPMPVSSAPAFFAARFKLPIIVAWSRPLKDGRYRCEVLDTIMSDESRDIWKTTQRCACAIERVIRRHPSSWVLNYNYFREPVSAEVVRELMQREGGSDAS